MSTCAGSEFLKLHAAGNDFIAPLNLPSEPEAWARRVCARRLGVGADGVIFPLPHPRLDFEFLYINYLGRRVPFCGHATRALAWLAVRRGLARGPEVRFWAWGKEWVAEVRDRWVWLDLGEVPSVASGGEIFLVESPVKHGVVFVRRLWNADLEALKEKLGAPPLNLNFAEVVGEELWVRTLEHGYPEEPLSCGTGAAAAAAVFLKERGFEEVRVITRGGPLRVSVSGGRLRLGGEITPVYEGRLCD